MGKLSGREIGSGGGASDSLLKINEIELAISRHVAPQDSDFLSQLAGLTVDLFQPRNTGSISGSGNHLYGGVSAYRLAGANRSEMAASVAALISAWSSHPSSSCVSSAPG